LGTRKKPRAAQQTEKGRNPTEAIKASQSEPAAPPSQQSALATVQRASPPAPRPLRRSPSSCAAAAGGGGSSGTALFACPRFSLFGNRPCLFVCSGFGAFMCRRFVLAAGRGVDRSRICRELCREWIPWFDTGAVTGYLSLSSLC
jgi:hypothetical protein